MIIHTQFFEEFESDEKLCQIVSGDMEVGLWVNNWIPMEKPYDALHEALSVKNVLNSKRLERMPAVIQANEFALFDRWDVY